MLMILFGTISATACSPVHHEWSAGPGDPAARGLRFLHNGITGRAAEWMPPHVGSPLQQADLSMESLEKLLRYPGWLYTLAALGGLGGLLGIARRTMRGRRRAVQGGAVASTGSRGSDQTIRSAEGQPPAQQGDAALFTPAEPRQDVTVFLDQEKYRALLAELVMPPGTDFASGNKGDTALRRRLSQAREPGAMVQLRVLDSGPLMGGDGPPLIVNRHYPLSGVLLRETSPPCLQGANGRLLGEHVRGMVVGGEQRGQDWRGLYSALRTVAERGIVAHSHSRPTMAVTGAIHPSGGRPAVLVMACKPDTFRQIRAALHKEFRLMHCDGGPQGWRQICRIKPELIICDVNVPGPGGDPFCRLLRADPLIGHTPVILLMPQNRAGWRTRSLEIGADACLLLPFDHRELRLLALNLVDRQRRMQERFRQQLKVEPGQEALCSADRKFLQKTIRLVEGAMGEDYFSIGWLAKEVGFSRSQLNRKLQKLTGMSTRVFIRTLQLKRAARLLRHGSGNVTEVAYQVGFTNLSHFAKIFEAQFGSLPSQYGARAQQSARPLLVGDKA